MWATSYAGTPRLDEQSPDRLFERAVGWDTDILGKICLNIGSGTEAGLREVQ